MKRLRLTGTVPVTTSGTVPVTLKVAFFAETMRSGRAHSGTNQRVSRVLPCADEVISRRSSLESAAFGYRIYSDS
jgi:hypothetical protein